MTFVYGFGRIDASGRVADRAIISALQHGQERHAPADGQLLRYVGGALPQRSTRPPRLQRVVVQLGSIRGILPGLIAVYSSRQDQ
jgi:hypothetical protein